MKYIIPNTSKLCFTLCICSSEDGYFQDENTVDIIVVQLENQTLHFRERAQSKCGTFDYLDYRPGGGDKKVRMMAYYHNIL